MLAGLMVAASMAPTSDGKTAVVYAWDRFVLLDWINCIWTKPHVLNHDQRPFDPKVIIINQTAQTNIRISNVFSEVGGGAELNQEIVSCCAWVRARCVCLLRSVCKSTVAGFHFSLLAEVTQLKTAWTYAAKSCLKLGGLKSAWSCAANICRMHPLATQLPAFFKLHRLRHSLTV